MRTKFFCTNFLNTARGPGHPGKIPGTSRIPLFETQGRQSFEGGHEVFGHHPFAWKTPTPPGGLRTQKLNLCALFSCLISGPPRLRVQSRSRTRLRIAASIAFLFRACFKGILDTIAPQGGPNPVFLNPVFEGSSCIHCAALHGLALARKLHDFPEL